MKRFAPLVLLFCLPVSILAAASKETLPKTLTGKVVSIADGDSVDCPERGQPFGTRARQSASKAVFGKQVTVKVTDKDKYGRLVGRVLYPGKDDEGKPKQLDLSAELALWWMTFFHRRRRPTQKTRSA
jgi:endonuclease YncB( thermonuclease family)